MERAASLASCLIGEWCPDFVPVVRTSACRNGSVPFERCRERQVDRANCNERPMFEAVVIPAVTFHA